MTIIDKVTGLTVCNETDGESCVYNHVHLFEVYERTARIPTGVTRADAEAALADAGAWVEVEHYGDFPLSARVRSESDGEGKTRNYVHRDDLPPADPDAELVEKMARKIESEMYNGFTDRARALLAIVREHEARS